LESSGRTGKLSVIVTAYNNGDTIAECLRSLQDQTLRPVELTVVVDASSHDNTAKVVEEFASRSGFKVEMRSGIGRSLARNIGWKLAPSEFVMFADGDDVYAPDYIEKTIECILRNPHLGGVCVGGAPLKEGNGLIERYQTSFGDTDARMSDHKEGPEWAFVYRKRCLQEVGGFDEALSQAEDRDVCARVKKAGYEIGYVSGVHWRHRKPRTLVQLLAKEYGSGRRRVPYETKNRKLGTLAISLFPLGSLIFLALLGLFSPLLTVTLLVVGVVAYIGVMKASGRRNSPRALDSLAFPLIALLGKLAASLGTVAGISQRTVPARVMPSEVRAN
jgi:GT2 family glycosyltransferase